TYVRGCTSTCPIRPILRISIKSFCVISMACLKRHRHHLARRLAISREKRYLLRKPPRSQLLAHRKLLPARRPPTLLQLSLKHFSATLRTFGSSKFPTSHSTTP